MILTKRFYWNTNKINSFGQTSFHNLYVEHENIEKSVSFLFCKINTMSKNANNKHTKRTLASLNNDKKEDLDSKKVISTTAFEVSSADDDVVGNCDNSTDPTFRGCRRTKKTAGNQESTVKNVKSTSNSDNTSSNRRRKPRKYIPPFVNPIYTYSNYYQNVQYAQNSSNNATFQPFSSIFPNWNTFSVNNYVAPNISNPCLLPPIPGIANIELPLPYENQIWRSYSNINNVELPLPSQIWRSYSDIATSTRRLRKNSLFRNVKSEDDVNTLWNSSRKQSNKKERQDKEIIEGWREWIPTQEGNLDDININATRFKVMSYNVLAQDLLTEHAYLYKQHSPRSLLWEIRWKNLYEEIVFHDADILCLQEVQESHLKDYFSKLNELGYVGIYKKRTGQRTDGCAFYYKKSVFKVLENVTVEFNQGNMVLDRDNVAIIAKLVPRGKPDSHFVVATTHLLYNPRRQDVRLAQTQVLLAEVERMAYKKNGQNSYVPIIITGDFNSEPTSAVYKLVVEGNLRYDNLANRTLAETNSTYNLAGPVLLPPELRITDNCQHLDLLEHRAANVTLPTSEASKLIQLRHSKKPTPTNIKCIGNETLFSTGRLSHGLQLKSAFLHKVGDDQEGTTNQNGWITVDYIFYSGIYDKGNKKIEDGKLKLLSRYSIPTTNQLKKVKNIPNFALGSDHLALLTKFKLEY